MSGKRQTKPLVYSCSGCSNVAQLANHVAVSIDRSGLGEMSCIAGVGGNVPSLVRRARSGRPILALDGCHLHCTRHTLARAGISPDLHLTLTDFDLHKRYGEDFDIGTRHDMTLLVVQAALDAGFPIAPPRVERSKATPEATPTKPRPSAPRPDP